jgi:TMEM199 family protein
MVLLCMTPAVAEVVELYLQSNLDKQDQDPSLKSPAEGNPISHGQLIDISRFLKRNRDRVHAAKDGTPFPTRLEELLRGCTVYIPPKIESKPKVSGYRNYISRPN